MSIKIVDFSTKLLKSLIIKKELIQNDLNSDINPEKLDFYVESFYNYNLNFKTLTFIDDHQIGILSTDIYTLEFIARLILKINQGETVRERRIRNLRVQVIDKDSLEYFEYLKGIS